MLHIVWYCDFGLSVWSLHGLDGLSLQQDFNGFRDWAAYILAGCEKRKAALCFCLAWKIWMARNDRVWNGVNVDAQLILSQVQVYMQDWWRANEVPSVSTRRLPMAVRWQPPDSNCWKVNVDAATFASEGRRGWGPVVRDSHGSFQAAACGTWRSMCEASMAEAKALEYAMSWAASMDLQQVIFEMDDVRVVRAAVNSMPDILVWSSY